MDSAYLIAFGNVVKANFTEMGESLKKVRNPLRVRGLLPATVGSSDARTRVRQRMRRLLEDRGKTNRALAQWLGHGDQWVSNLLAGRFALSLDELDRVAQFFTVPPSEIVRVSEDPWELSPTEMRAVRALRMLPPSVRDHVVTLADYLIGATPEEVDILKSVRELTEENRRLVERWIEVTLRTQASEPTQLTPDDLRATSELRTATTRRIRRGRPG